MSYLTSFAEKTSIKNTSLSESLSLKKGISAPAVPALQRQADEDEMQMKREPVQLIEEDEPLQGKFAAVQLAGEEEEPMQGKFVAQLEGEEDELQMKKEPAQLVGEEEEPVQGKFNPALRKNAEAKTFQFKETAVQRQEEGKSSNNTGMPSHLKSGVENLSGFSMDDVKVHYNSDKPKQLQAHAYAQGTDIHIAPGQEKHLPHEAWHVAQQKQGRVQATTQMKTGTPVNDDKGLENEADVMGAQASQVGKAIQMQRWLRAGSTSNTIQKKNIIQKEDKGFDVESIKEDPSKKGEGEEAADSIVDSSSGALSSSADFMTASPLTYTNSSNTKVEKGETVTDEDKAVTKGHSADPLGKAASAAGVGVGVYSGIFGMYQAIQKIREGEVNSVIEGVFSAFGATSTMVKSGADVAKTTAEEGSDTASEAGKTSSIAGTVTDGIDAVKSLVLTIKGIYDAYKDATSPEGSSTKEKIESGLATVRGLVESAGKAVSMGKTIADMLQTGSAGLAAAVPGLGIALSSIDIAIGIFNLIKAKCSESFVKEQLKKNMWEVGGGTFEKGKEGRKQRERYVKTFEEELTLMKGKRALLLKEKTDLAAAGASTATIDDKMKSLDDSIALGEKQFAGLKENNALTHLKGVNQDRKYNAGFEIAVNIVKIVGDVVSLVPEPGSQIAVMSLKLIAGGSKVAKGVGSKIIQWGRDKAAGKSDSALNKLFDSTKSSDAVKERHTGTIKYIFTEIKSLPEDSESPAFQTKATIIEQIISSTGCDPKALYRTVSGPDKINEGVQLLYKSLSK